MPEAIISLDTHVEKASNGPGDMAVQSVGVTCLYYFVCIVTL